MIPIVRLTLEKTNELSGFTERIFGCEEAAPIFRRQLGNLARESVGLLCLDTHNQIINYSDITFGKVNRVDVDYAAIMKIALLANAQYILIAHNHPTGILEPSPTDVESTKKLGALSKLFGIELIDSLIVGPTNDYTSIRSIIKESHVSHDL
ncbi:JAB domain-containing protein [Bacillus paramycoides]|uniref:JAB domain-containing protein n=1 Tax=Bacillus paramycoides TaxID=2026194 RepID=UPI002E1C4ADD|nr:JAB domain-containing protein [Bacillus paramycoides]